MKNEPRATRAQGWMATGYLTLPRVFHCVVFIVLFHMPESKVEPVECFRGVHGLPKGSRYSDRHVLRKRCIS